MKSQLLSKWRPRDVEAALLNIARHTKIVGVSKVSLSIVAFGLILLVIFLPVFNEDSGGGVRIVFSNVEKGESSQPAMTRPMFQGVDADGQPYSVSADIAEQVDDNNVALKNLNADITLQDGTWLAVKAKNGQLNLQQKTLALSGNVYLYYDKGFEFRTEEAFVNMGKRTAWGKVPADVQSSMGLLEAKGFEIFGEAKRATFRGPVRLTITMQE